MENESQRVNTDHRTSPIKGTCCPRRYDGAWMRYLSASVAGVNVWPKPLTLTTHMNGKIAMSSDPSVSEETDIMTCQLAIFINMTPGTKLIHLPSALGIIYLPISHYVAGRSLFED
ncbi:hypothetical protein PCH_Pc21g19750 [Penicillium rubens Wisconsin 54-1255]|uniref:Uncharacterized protein n=1 Tax=Penicillium rubens (strain ATCC 28089 / DSM 1075 / NRRL 1951 / Wisconsin 54-1255) TaxID=500485 RepID=B6HJX3_PENRW|nr:hypothetical protein PCH_Pc21g19750 [Penicillium rubens Wisconsin 54-1255]